MLSTSRRFFVIPVALAALLVTLSAPVASAQWAQRRPDWNDRSGASGYDNGYRQGVSQGERDARARRSYDYDRHTAYRSVGGDSRYRDTFRQGFAQGYRDGYYRNASNGRNGSWGNGGYANQYPDNPSYGGGWGYGSSNIAYETGLRDGYREGADAVRDGDRFDPLREKRYRNGDSGYNKRYGSKEVYQTTYRQGYREGYERAYRESSRGRGPWLGWPR